MERWLDRLRRWASSATASAPAPTEGSVAGAPSELSALSEIVRKTARTVTRIDARLDDLRSSVSALESAAERDQEELLAPLMDALDALSAAHDALAAGHSDGAATGLLAIQGQLEGVLERAGYRRHHQLGAPVDGRLQRVVGTVPAAAAADGSVARVVRAAITRGDRIVRGGEVIAAKAARGGNVA